MMNIHHAYSGNHFMMLCKSSHYAVYLSFI